MIENGLYVDKETERHTSVQQFSLVNPTFQTVALSSAKRVRLTFVNSGGDLVVVRPTPPNDPKQSIQLPTAGGILSLDYKDYGSLLQSAWTATAGTTATTLSVLDTVEQ